MNIWNVDYGRFVGAQVHPLLAEVIRGVYVKAPTLKFLAKVVDSNNRVAQFDVLDDVAVVGNLHIVYGRTGHSVAIRSDNIKKQRGIKDTKRTTNVKVAIKTCLEAFKSKSQDRMAKAVLSGFDYAMSALNLSTRDAVLASIRHGARGTQIGCFLGEFQGGPLPDNIRDMVATEKLVEKVAAFRAAQTIAAAESSKHGVVLSPAPEGAFVMVDLGKPDAVVVIKDTYALPTNYQEKLAILKIMGKNEPVPNIGFKYDDSDTAQFGLSYFLVGGDVITEGA